MAKLTANRPGRRRGLLSGALFVCCILTILQGQAMLHHRGTSEVVENDLGQQEPISPSPDNDCTKQPELADPFPPNFDPELYSKRYLSKVPEGTSLDWQHYDEFGKPNGWKCTAGQKIRAHINQFVDEFVHPSLEIGPFCNPMLVGNPEKIRYFDVLDYDALKKRAVNIGYPIKKKNLTIHYIDPHGDLNRIPDAGPFSMVTSSHCIEHQLDLVRHFKAVSRLLVDGGYYVILVSHIWRGLQYCPKRSISHSLAGTRQTILLRQIHFRIHHCRSSRWLLQWTPRFNVA